MTRQEREEQGVVLEHLRRDAFRLATRFALPLRSLEAESPRVRRRYGICYEDGSIRIRLRHVRTGKLLRYSALVDTLCHELAHLRHFDHGPRFQVFYRGLLGYARRAGIYRPRPRPAPPAPAARPAQPQSARPVQLELF
ncbi:MAG: Wss1p-related putative metallopeptidase [Myxococcota bacterium]